MPKTYEEAIIHNGKFRKVTCDDGKTYTGDITEVDKKGEYLKIRINGPDSAVKLLLNDIKEIEITQP